MSRLRKTMILMAVAALLVALVSGTAAAKQNGKDRATYNFKGTVEEVALDDSYLVVDVTDGNRRAREHLGLQQFAVTDEYTEIQVNEEDAELAALATGDEVNVQSKASKTTTEFVARKISTKSEED